MLPILALGAALAAPPPEPVPLPAAPDARPLALSSVEIVSRPLLLELSADALRERIEGRLSAAGYPSRAGVLALEAALVAATCKGAVSRGCEVAMRWTLAAPEGHPLWTSVTRGSAWVEEDGAEAQALGTSLERAVSSLLANPSFVRELSGGLPRVWSAQLGSAQVASAQGQPQARRCEVAPADPAAAIVQVQGPSERAAGVLISPDGRVVTLAAVVGEASAVQVWPPSGAPLRAQVVPGAQDSGLAVLQLEGSEHPCLPRGPVPAVGEPVRAVGVRLERPADPVATEPAPEPSPREVAGHLTATEAQGEGSVLRTSLELPPRQGFEGAPLLDVAGRWVALLDGQLVAVAPGELTPGPAAPVSALPVSALPVSGPPPYQARPDRSWLFARPDAARVRSHFVLGAAGALAASTALVLSTQTVYQDWKVQGSTVNEWRGLQAANTAGWLVGALGLGLGLRAATLREPEPVWADPAEIFP
jgi:S1-C subfamily serine protease